jgi:hypothetical protein
MVTISPIFTLYNVDSLWALTCSKKTAKYFFYSNIMFIFVPANEVDKELLMLTQIVENFGLLYVTNS